MENSAIQHSTKNFFNFINDKNLNNINLKNSSPPFFNSISTNICGNVIINRKPTIGSLSSLKKFNFDFPKMNENDYSKDKDRKSKSFVNHKEDNNSIDENEKKSN